MRIDEKKLNLLLCDRCMSRRELAEKSGLSVNSILYATNGKRSMMPQNVGRLAKVLGVSGSALIVDE